MIDDEIYNKKKQFELITNKILDKCNIFNHKSKFKILFYIDIFKKLLYFISLQNTKIEKLSLIIQY